MLHLQDKVTTLEHLFDLFPDSLPLRSCGRTCFGLDPDDFDDLGYAGALNRCFEINWGMRAHGICFTERGDKLASTIGIFRQALNELTPRDDIGLVELWLDVFIDTAGSVVSSR
ncbi:hypothetical protein FKP32DRAFT_1580140 [Trametes sanguinea]|nr:hypothetical protein FKP32DRAFT_1580140 [Trametes sanguinea]